MRAALLLAGLCALAFASTVPKHQQQQLYSVKNKYKISDKVVLKRQQDILQLLTNVNQPNVNQEQVIIAKTFDITTSQLLYTNPQVVEEFIDVYSEGMLPKGEIFSINYDQHLKQAVALFKILHSAKDYDTFFKTAAWARDNVNEGMFVYSLSVAVVHRPDTADIVLPPIYEINPDLFLNSNVMKKAQKVKQLYAGLSLGQLQQILIQQQQQQQPTWWQQLQMKSGMSPAQQWKLRQILAKTAADSDQQELTQQQQIQLEQLRQELQQEQMQEGQGQSYLPYQNQQTLTRQGILGQMGQIGQMGQMGRMEQMGQMGQVGLRQIQTGQVPIGQGQITPEQIAIKQMLEEQEQLQAQKEQMGRNQWLQQQGWGSRWGGGQQGYQTGQQIPTTQTNSLLLQELLEQELLQNLNQQQQVQGSLQGTTPKLTIHANYSGLIANPNKEQTLAYFTEDVGLNAAYYYLNIYNPFWLPMEKMITQPDSRGEQYCYVLQQLVARYYLERLSNGLGKVKTLDLSMPIKVGYNPALTYPNGVPFPVRPNNVLLKMQRQGENDDAQSNITQIYQLVKDYQRRIRDAIDLGYVVTTNGKQIGLVGQEGLDILGNLIQGNPESPNNRFYGNLQVLIGHLLGYSNSALDQQNVAPGALEQPETSLRDPAFYQLAKKIVSLAQKYQNYLPSYNIRDLYIPGVKVQDVQVDRLITFFDGFDIDVTNALYLSQQDVKQDVVQINVRQKRLNHKPFTYAINVNSETPVDVVVRVFIGPKFDEFGRQIPLNKNRQNFVQIDKFVQSLGVGQNIIQRNSRQSHYVADKTTARQLYVRVMTAYNSAQEIQLDGSEASWGIPNRLLLPKGTRNGKTYQLYVILTPHQQKVTKTKIGHSFKALKLGMFQGQQISDGYPLGYPFDRNIQENIFYVPNSCFKDIVIYHKNVEDILASQL